MEQLLTLNVPINGNTTVCFEAARNIIMWTGSGQELYNVLIMGEQPRSPIRVLLARPPVRGCGAYVISLSERRVVVTFYGSSLRWQGTANDFLGRLRGDASKRE